ncbi:MAG: transposase [Acidobacteria bacterium]|nr:transposase [Acidobacteriota bacterium]
MILPVEMVAMLGAFAPLFSDRVWLHVQILVAGAILANGTRTVTQALRVMGLSQERRWTNYHRVLNRAVWSPLHASKILLGLIIRLLPVSSTIVIGADDTIERRKGKKIKHVGVYRDGVRSSKKHVVKCFGLKWVTLMVLVQVPFSSRVWALPFLTALGRAADKSRKKSQLQNTQKRRWTGHTRRTTKHRTANGHKTSIDLVGQMTRIVRRWLPQRAIVLVVDGAFAAVKLAHLCLASKVVMVSRIRLDAALYHQPAPHVEGKRGPKPQKGQRQRRLKEWAARCDTPWEEIEVQWYGGRKKQLLVFSRTALWYTPGWAPVEIRYVLVRDPEGKLRDEAFFCTDINASPQQILEWVVMRWSVEVTFEEARAHLGVETQRQWSDKAVARTTPALFGLFSVVTLVAMQMSKGGEIPVAQAAWYKKEEPTFSDCIGLVRRQMWKARKLVKSADEAEFINFPSEDFDLLIDSLPLAA